MTSLLKKFSSFTAAIAALVLAVSVATAAADGAIVANHGNNLGDTCSVTAFGGYYVGFVTYVSTPSGNLHGGCVTKLASGSGVNRTTIINFGSELLVVNPGGIATLSF